jgi:hypothetical protein
MDDKLERLIMMQRNLQAGAYGIEYAKMDQDARVQYIRDQHQALIMEMSEVLDEVDWKPWTKPYSVETGRFIHRDEFVGELVDVLHFWINMVLAVSGKMSATEIADEIFTRYALKNRTNTQRQVDGYDGKKTKCGGCGRALDDFAVECRRAGDQGYCVKTNSDINYISSGPEPKSVIIKPVTCPHCMNAFNDYGCVPPTTERWGHCGADARQLPPIKIPTNVIRFTS